MNPATLDVSKFATRIDNGQQFNSPTLVGWSAGDTVLTLAWGLSGSATLPLNTFSFDGATPTLESALGAALPTIASQAATWIPIPP